MSDLASRAVELDKWSLGRLVSVFEDAREDSAAERARLLCELEAHPRARRGVFVGVTGTPGAGKSSLVGELARRLIADDPGLAVAVLAVDPTSHVSGGALLGDRTRVKFPLREPRLFFRSQASDRELGGVSRSSFQVCRALRHVFDLVFVETVGIGQSEIEIQHVADWTMLVLQPLAGDQVQFMKAGIMEIPDAFVLNKCDEREAADASYHALRASLGLARVDSEEPPPLYRTSAVTGEGVSELAADLRELAAGGPRRAWADKEAYFFVKWVRDEFGRRGLHRLFELAPTAADFVRAAGGVDEAQLAFARGAPSPSP